MSILQVIFTVLSLLVIIYAFIKPQVSAGIYLLYGFMAPYLYLGGYIVYSRILAVFFVLIIFVKLWNKINRRDYRPYFPLLYLLLGQLLLLPFSNVFSYSFNQFSYKLVPIIFIVLLYGCMKVYPKSIIYYKWILFLCMSIATLYGFYLTTIPGINPYKLLQMPMFGQEFNEAYAAGNSGISNITTVSDSRLYGRISSIFNHPMEYGLHLGFYYIYSIYLFKGKSIFIVTFSIVVLLAALTSGVRTTLGALILTLIIILLYYAKKKYIFLAFLGGVLCLNVFPIFFPHLMDYVLSIFDNKSSTIVGSSIDMRINQLEGCFNIVKNNLLFGMGYEWSSWYNTNIGAHPKALFFESLFFIILVNTGVVGVVLWIIFAIKYYKYISKAIKDRLLKTCLLSLLLYYFVFCSITGDFGIDNLYLYYTVLVGCYFYEQQNQKRTWLSHGN